MTVEANLKLQRGRIKRQLTVAEKFLTSINDQSHLSVLNLDFRLEKHLELWHKFDLVQTQIAF